MDSSVSQDPARTIGSYLWYKAYVSLTPSTCFILDDGHGRAVGYIIGTADTVGFAERWRSTFAPIVDPKLVPPPEETVNDPAMETEMVRGLRRAVYGAECSVFQGEGREDLLRRFPAHLHINLLPEFQRRGWGPALMQTFVQHVKALGADGVHLGMVRGNHGARRFYERLGFGLCQEVLDGGISGEVGREGEAIWLVREI